MGKSGGSQKVSITFLLILYNHPLHESFGVKPSLPVELDAACALCFWTSFSSAQRLHCLIRCLLLHDGFASVDCSSFPAPARVENLGTSERRTLLALWSYQNWPWKFFGDHVEILNYTESKFKGKEQYLASCLPRLGRYEVRAVLRSLRTEQD